MSRNGNRPGEGAADSVGKASRAAEFTRHPDTTQALAQTLAVQRKSGANKLALYDPEKGLKSIAIAEAGEKHFRRAKDPTKLFKAIETKIKAQADYVVWRDGTARPAHRPKKNSFSSERVLPDGDPGDVIVHRWRRKLTKRIDDATVIDEDKLAEVLDDSQHRCQRIVEQENANTIRGTEGTGEFERYTPKQYIEAARKVLGAIDLDPASNKQAQEWIQAEQFFTEKDDGLAQEWFGRVWLNPPYHRELAPKFIDRLVREFTAGRVTAAILLTNNSTETEWFYVALKACASICFTRGRINFHVPKGPDVSPTQGQAFFYFGDDVAAFEREFASIGFGVRPIWTFRGGVLS